MNCMQWLCEAKSPLLNKVKLYGTMALLTE